MIYSSILQNTVELLIRLRIDWAGVALSADITMKHSDIKNDGVFSDQTAPILTRNYTGQR